MSDGSDTTFALFGVIDTTPKAEFRFPYVSSYVLKQKELNPLIALPPNLPVSLQTYLDDNPSTDVTSQLGLCIANLERDNASSLLGTLDYMQRFVSMMQTDNTCPIRWDSEGEANNQAAFASYRDAATRVVHVPGVIVVGGSHVQEGGGVVYPAIPCQLAMWAVVVTLSAGIGLLAARRCQRARPGDLPRALSAFGAGYAAAATVAALLLNLDPETAPGFPVGRVVLHLSAVGIALAGAVAYARARPPGPGGVALESVAAGVYVAALAAAVAI